MTNGRSFLRAAAVLLSGPLLLTLIKPSHPQGKDDRPLKLESDLVVVDATITDKNGNYVRNLKAEDFALFEDGQRRSLDFFEANEQSQLSRPLAAVFALDLSGSIRPEELELQRQAAESFIKLVRPDSVFAVITFNYEVKVLQGFTSDPVKVGQAFQKIREAGGSTRLFAAIDRAVTMLKSGPRYRDGRRLKRVVLAISDGYATESIDQRRLVERANEAEITVYSITLPSYGLAQVGGGRMVTLLDASLLVPATGGKDFSADSSDFTPAVRAIAEEIRAGYTLAYYPPDNIRRDGLKHQIRVEVTKPGAIIRLNRDNYTSPKDPRKR
ncbi:MAG TPA: VWA domain-containing protein [Blastocatellia bacterium]|nr:VWA domain-containing protein [Blastocatellia bacterium]